MKEAGSYEKKRRERDHQERRGENKMSNSRVVRFEHVPMLWCRPVERRG